jgi:hypothetical protein
LGIHRLMGGNVDIRKPEQARGLAHLWLRGGRNVGANVISTLVATGVVSLVAAAIIAFSRTNSANAAAFRILLAAAILGALMATFGALSQAVYAWRAAAGNRAATDLGNMVLGRLESLESRIPSIDWSYDAAEHDRRIYERIRKVVENPSTHEYKVLTIVREAAQGEFSDAQREAIREYHRSIENALQSRSGFVYERLVVLRAALKGRRSARDLLSDLIAGRPEYVEHYRRVFKPLIPHAEGVRSDIRFYADTGRLFDLAFAVALDRDRKPTTLLLEIGVTRPAEPGKAEHPLLGILALENPNQQLADAFLLAHQALRLGNTSVEYIKDEVVRNSFRL